MAGGDDDHTDIAVAMPTYVVGPGTTLGEYEIESAIGEGAMGQVYAAHHQVIGKRAAIKVLRAELTSDEAQVERFIGEARVVNQIGHPNIVDIFDFGEMPDGRRYFAMELLVGETLRDRLRRGPMQVHELAMVIRPLARALEAAHAQGIVHRDLKPENVFLVARADEQPLVKLLDFGVAKLHDDAARLYKTGAGQLVGTPMYMAPEQARDSKSTDARSDVYALGAMAFEMLTGRVPFPSVNVYEVVTAHLTEPPPVPSKVAQVPDELDDLIVRMMAKDPAQRPSLAQVRVVLGSTESTPLPSARQVKPEPDAWMYAAEPPVMSKRAGWIVAAVLVVAVGFGVAIAITRDRGSAPVDAAPAVAAVVVVPVDAAVAIDAAIGIDAAVPIDATPPVPQVERSHLLITVRNATSAAITVDGHRATADTLLPVGHHHVTVTANGQTRSLDLDLTASGAKRTVTFDAPPTNDHDLLRPGSLTK